MSRSFWLSLFDLLLEVIERRYRDKFNGPAS